MYTTSLDVLYLVLSIGLGLLLLVLVIAIIQIIRILSDVNQVSTKAKDTMDLVNHYLWQPIKIAMQVMEKSKMVARKMKKKK
jgi:hypothetical protein